VRRNANPGRRSKAAGFTLVELLVSLALLAVIAGAVFEQINQMQRKSSSEAMKLDLTQSAREFLDQTVRDLHMSGYPGPTMYSNRANAWMVAGGLLSASPTRILFEGDVNNDGTVYSVNIFYVANDPNDANCPCIRRSVLTKQSVADPANPPVAATYTEIQHVVPPGAAPGQSGENLFAYYNQTGDPVDPTDPSQIGNVKTVKINLSLASALRDPAGGGPLRTSMSATARLNQ